LKFYYKNKVIWQGEKKGILESEGKPQIFFATPPEFKGHKGYWSPEDFLVASVNCCIMTTFLYYAFKENLNLLSYESRAEGIVEFIDRKLKFTEINVYPKIKVDKKDKEKAKELIESSEKACLISNSVNVKVKVILEDNI
jgi:organic hydroperoxide reductase OsmC/OhrA